MKWIEVNSAMLTDLSDKVGESAELTAFDKLGFRVERGAAAAEVSWNAPMLRMTVVCYPLGSSGHSWAVVCAGKSAVEHKGVLTATKAIAATGIELMSQSKILAKLREEWKNSLKTNPVKTLFHPKPNRRSNRSPICET